MAKVYAAGRGGPKVTKNAGGKIPGVGRPTGSGPQSRLSAGKAAAVARSSNPNYNVATQGGTSQNTGQGKGLAIQGSTTIGRSGSRTSGQIGGKSYAPARRRGRMR